MLTKSLIVVLLSAVSFSVAAGQVSRQWLSYWAGPRSMHEWPVSVSLGADRQPDVFGIGGYEEGLRPVLLRYDRNGWLTGETSAPVAGHAHPIPIHSARAPDGGSAIVGVAAPWPGDGTDRMLVVKYDREGEVEWHWVHEAQGNEWHSVGRAIAADSLSNLYAGGRIVDHEDASARHAVDAFLVKFSPTGQVLWRARFDGRDRLTDSVQRILVDEARGVLYGVGSTGVEGDPPGFNRTNDILILKYDLNGNLLWSRQWNGPANLNDSANGAVLLSDGSLLVAGAGVFSTQSSFFNTAAIQLHYGADGSLLREVYPDLRLGRTVAASLDTAPDGSIYLCAGITPENRDQYETDSYIVKRDSSFGLIWETRLWGSDMGTRRRTSSRKGIFDLAGQFLFCANFQDGSPDDALIAGIDPDSGRVVWIDTQNAPANNVDVADDLVADGRGNVYLTGSGGYVPGHGADIYLIKYCVLPGDATRDGRVDSFDLEMVLELFGQTTGLPDRPTGDLNGDRIIDDIDLAIVLTCYGRECTD